MFLEKISIWGFKSFAKMQEVFLNSGLTLIVGPNGCGKSNFLDAIRFCIGEDNLKLLRVSHITDLISYPKFGDSNFAEVTLFFNNETLYVSEFKDRFYIRRRLYKDGTSEYFFNKELLSLKDYNELLSRLKLKRSPYMFINQGRIENIVLGNNVDLKTLIEEASCIDVLKMEEEIASKKLEKSKENLNSLVAFRNELKEKYEKIKNDFLLKDKYKKLKKNLEALEKEIVLKKLFNISLDLNELKKKLNIKDMDKIFALSNFSISNIKEKLEFYSFQEKTISENTDVLKNEIEEIKSKIAGVETKIKKFEQEKKNKLSLCEKVLRIKEQIGDRKLLLNKEAIKLKDSINNKKIELLNLNEEINKYTKSFTEVVNLILKIYKDSKLEEFNSLKENMLNSLKLFEESLNIRYVKEIRLNLIRYLDKEDDLLSLLKSEIEPIFEQNIDLRKYLIEKNNFKVSLEREIINLESFYQDKIKKLNETSLELKHTELAKFKNEDEIKLIDKNLSFLLENKNEFNAELFRLNSKLESLNQDKSNIKINLEKFLKESEKSDINTSDEFSSLNVLDMLKDSSYYEYMKKQIEYDLLLNYNLSFKSEINKFNLAHENFPKFEIEKYIEEKEKLQKEINIIEFNNYVLFNIEKEFEETNEKFEKINSQVEDLKASENYLRKLQKKIKKEISKKFNDAFKEIDTHFSYFFNRMFKGTAKLVYNKSTDKVEIEVSFDKKNVKRNNMLSGGEHALISISFLFALYYYSPAYFCILDEIDASLDFENSNKLSRLFKELSEKIQLMIITHNIYISEGSKNLIGITIDNGESKIFSI